MKSMPASWMGIQDARLVSELYAQALLFTSHLVSAIGYQGIKDVLLKATAASRSSRRSSRSRERPSKRPRPNGAPPADCALG